MRRKIFASQAIGEHDGIVEYNGEMCNLREVTLSSRSQFPQLQTRGLILISGYQTFVLTTLSQITGLASWVAAQYIHLYEVLKQQWEKVRWRNLNLSELLSGRVPYVILELAIWDIG